MSKKDKKSSEKLCGKEGFETYYSALFKERWPALKNALFAENVYARIFHKDCEEYFLDPASVFAAMCLPLENSERILDMCAAPGGKSLVIASRMPEDATLLSNERSPQRKKRLTQVIENSLPQEIKKRITVTCSDAAKMCIKQTEVYDRILLDAPCSSERHVLSDEKYLAEWSPSRIKSLSMEQWALLSSAYRLLVPGGYLLYSTCALCPCENDDVVARLFKKFDDVELVFAYDEPKILNQFDFCKMDIMPVPERTKYGFHILPDQKEKCGPIWFTLIKKTEKNDAEI